MELGVTQRCGMHCVSQTDIDEAYKVGKSAIKYAMNGYHGFMVGIKRLDNNPYNIETFMVEASKVANNIKYFPLEWINKRKNNVTDDAIEYIAPLIMGSTNLILENGIPKYMKLY